MADNNQSPPPSPAVAVAEPRVAVIPDLNCPSFESVMLSSLEDAMAALPWRAEILRRSYERLIQGSPVSWNDMLGNINSTQDLSLGLAALQEHLHAAGAGPSGHAGLAVANTAGEGMEGGAADVAEQDCADGEEIKAVAEEEVVAAEQDGGEVAAMEMKVGNEAMDVSLHAGAASDHVGMDIKGKGRCHDLDDGEDVAVVDRKDKGKVAGMEPLLEQGEYMLVVETVEEANKASEGRISRAFDQFDDIALKSAVEKLRLKKKMRVPSIDWTEEEEEAAYFEETLDDQANEEQASIEVTPDDQAKEEAAIDVPIQEDVSQELDMEMSSDEEEGELKETKDEKASREEEDGKVQAIESNVPQSAGTDDRRRWDPAPRRELVVACERMDPFEVAELVITAGRDIAGEFLPALRRAPNAPALALHAAAYVLSSASASAPRGDIGSGSWENLAALLRTVRDIVACRPRLARRLEARRPKEVSTEMAKSWCAMIADELEHEPAVAAAWALLQFVAAYGIAGNMETEEMMMACHTVRDMDGGADMIKSLGLADRATELINRLLQNAKHIDAVKVARAFNLIDRFPPVTIIKAYVEKVKEAAQDMVSKSAVSLQALDRAMEVDVAALRSAKEAIDVHDRGSDYRYTIMQEVHKLMGDYEKKKRSLSIGSSSSSRRRSKRRRSNQEMPHGGSQTIPAPPVFFPIRRAYLCQYHPFQSFGPQYHRN